MGQCHQILGDESGCISGKQRVRMPKGTNRGTNLFWRLWSEIREDPVKITQDGENDKRRQRWACLFEGNGRMDRDVSRWRIFGQHERG